MHYRASMKFINLFAKRAVKLTTNFNNVLILDETEPEFIFQSRSFIMAGNKHKLAF